MASSIVGSWKCYKHQAVWQETPMHYKVGQYTDYIFHSDFTWESHRKGLFGKDVSTDGPWDYDSNLGAYRLMLDYNTTYAICRLDGDEMLQIIVAGPDESAGYYFKRA